MFQLLWILFLLFFYTTGILAGDGWLNISKRLLLASVSPSHLMALEVDNNGDTLLDMVVDLEVEDNGDSVPYGETICWLMKSNAKTKKYKTLSNIF